MRYSLALSALCAAGALAHNIDKRAYVTDWTVVTLTTTITETPAAAATTAAAVTTTAATSAEPAVKVANVAAVADVAAEASTVAPAPAVETSSTVVVPVVESTSTSSTSIEAATTIAPTTEAATTAAPTTEVVATTPVVQVAAANGAWTTAWTSYWTSAWTSAAQPTTLATSTSTSASSTATASTAYQSTVLYNHNVHRSNHSASSLDWDSALESSAYTLAAKCVYEHDTSIDGGGYGQNIGYGVESSAIGEMITNLMYNDEMGYYAELYGEADPDMTNFDLWGHFSQIVWKGTTKVGCATVTCPSLGNVDAAEALPFTVCNYSPPGNYAGEYGTNVGKPLGNAMYVAS
ncbi:CAP domain-containing protein [Aspergillus homomorphus CBS 101889]|uniref:PR-1-like protein n=1 Tax=Aspergillus homomorphus (strain CBS 101889) TaxID=1450537 RepID=A0A395I9Y9_ASPHC|nr:PR-1-like protein [Aspergillus homomorphus CBS 101889]RAL16846.1 PR-1-like protein [Aspergillus homomorphus CBS 101889]